MLEENLRTRLMNGQAVFGTWVRIPSPIVVEVLGHTGMDFLHLDLEHSPIDWATLDHMVLAGYKQQIPLAVRTATQNPADLYRLMDIGISMLILPRMETAEQCRSLLKGVRYSPHGERGIGGPVRANDWGVIGLDDHMKQASYKTLVLAQIESRAGLENLDEILNVPGIDIIYIGPLDLSQALGYPGQIEAPAVQEAILSMVKKIRGRGILVGIHVSNQEQVEYWSKQGIQYFTIGMDVSFLRAAGLNLVESIKRTHDLK
ncbi:HpcH/HpaI aldolase/citrate lyase family protein [Ammoniphilus sp. YIM 78166]|uniref:HpcH/HpaI aldolase family protein n=1 Tax=Ammoniphilus sp. YIM 78166 TaxID=1644106 RepID=UPI00106FB1DC|nr:aldolase/citrate lyase family protein [Ammoniphilus sp. YIM 78166]